MPDWRCSGVWSQNFETSTCASRPGPGRPRSIGSDGIGACTMVSQARQLSFGRTWRITLKLEGTYSSTSRSSWPMRLNTVPPQPGQVQAGSWVTVSRGRCAGSGLRTGCLRWRGLAGGLGSAGVPVGRLVRGVLGGSSSFEFADQQFELLDLAVELLRGAAEPRASQHGQLHLQLLDMQRLGVDLRRIGGDLDLLARQLGLQVSGEDPQRARVGRQRLVANDMDEILRNRSSRR